MVEERVLITDEEVSRGWECSHVLVVDLGGRGLENFVMRTVGYCALVKWPCGKLLNDTVPRVECDCIA